MTHRATLVAVAVVALACSTAPLAGQARDAAQFQGVLASRCPGAWVQVASGDAGRTRGLCESVGDGVLVLRSGGAERTFPQARVDTVWVRSHAGGAGAAMGGLAGAVAGLVLASAGACESPRGCDTAALYGGLAAAGGTAGALAGALVGSRMRIWRRIHPR
jgi:hypothetical protein